MSVNIIRWLVKTPATVAGSACNANNPNKEPRNQDAKNQKKEYKRKPRFKEKIQKIKFQRLHVSGSL